MARVSEDDRCILKLLLAGHSVAVAGRQVAKNEAQLMLRNMLAKTAASGGVAALKKAGRELAHNLAANAVNSTSSRALARGMIQTLKEALVAGVGAEERALFLEMITIISRGL